MPMRKIAPMLAVLIASTAPVLADAVPQTAWIDVPEVHPCQGKNNVFLATLERTPERTWVYHGFGSYQQARRDLVRRMARNPLPEEVKVRCDLSPYQPSPE